MFNLLNTYHALPPSLRTLVASARGYYLRWWRYGRQTEAWVEEALERESWSQARWQSWQEERCSFALHRAATKVPYYRALWEGRRRGGDRASWAYLENWPILEKEALRANPRAFVADDCEPRTMFVVHTSGTTGKPLRLWWSRETVQRWYALYEARIRRWHGVSYRDRWAMMGGQLIAPFKQDRPPFWVRNAGLRQLYLSSYHLKPAHARAYLDAIAAFEPTHVVAYPSSLYALAYAALEQGLQAPRLNLCVSNAEPLYATQRGTIEAVFGGPVRETYGMTEIVATATECEAGTLHLWPEVGIVEVRAEPDETLLPPTRVGQFVCTGLFNLDMPLIRYRVGDRGAVAPVAQTCSCGRTLPILQCVEGRMDDVVLTADGRRIGRLDPVFKADLHVREAQIVQESVTRLRVLVVPGAGYSAAQEKAIVARLRERVGDMEIEVEVAEDIPRTNGKLRNVISKVRASDVPGWIVDGVR